MSAESDRTECARAVVKSFYEGAARGHITDFADSLDENFTLLVPDYLPWGGTYDKAGYVSILPRVDESLDFARMNYESLTAEGGHVVALIVIAVRGTDDSIVISEHWDVGENGKARRLRVVYFDARPLLNPQARLSG